MHPAEKLILPSDMFVGANFGIDMSGGSIRCEKREGDERKGSGWSEGGTVRRSKRERGREWLRRGDGKSCIE